MSSRNDTLDLLLSALREEGSFVLASPEDADFFRKRELSPKKEPAPNAIAKEAPPPIPEPKPVLQNPAPPEPKPKAALQNPKNDPFSGAPNSECKAALHLNREPPPKVSSDFSAVRRLLSVVAPELAVLNEVPSDAMAKKIAERWKTKNQTASISILSLQEPPEQRALLEQIAKALDIYFGPAKIVSAEGIEKEKQWAAFLSVADLKMVIVCDYTLWQLNSLMQFYKETPAQGARVLGNTPLFLLPDLSLYLKDPLLKRSLWKALCQKLS